MFPILPFLLVVVMMFLQTACSEKEISSVRKAEGISKQMISLKGVNSPICYFDAVMRRNGLVDIAQVDTLILVDLKYASNDNFMNMNMYGCLKKAYLQPDIAQRLVLCQNWLNEQRPGYRIIVYDAARPQQIQKIMWDSLHLPIHEKVKFLSNPAFGSLHNFGAAVDVSIVDDKGNVLDMGAPFDHIGEEAHPVMEWQMLQSGTLTPLHIENRNLLRSVMRKGGFWGIQTEWWHFNAMTREVAAAKYTLIR